MNILLKFESLALFVLSIALFSLLPYSWWWYPVLFLVPDVGMVGYVFNTRMGAWIYNTFHLLFVAIGAILVGMYAHILLVELAGVVMMGHIGIDRFFGFGLKHEDSFKHTHLGRL